MDNPAPTDHPIHPLLRSRWSPRAFSDKPVEPDKLLRLLEAARWSPSSYNEQPWAFLLATKDQPAEYEKVLKCFVEFNQGWAKAAPVLLLAVAHRTFDKNGKDNPHGGHDVGQALAHLSVQAQAEGLSVHQMAGILPDEARKVFGVPEGWDVLTGVVIGYGGSPDTLPDQLRQRELAPRERKSLKSFVFTGGWGEARPGVGG